jgi:hypothetical protein
LAAEEDTVTTADEFEKLVRATFETIKLRERHPSWVVERAIDDLLEGRANALNDRLRAEIRDIEGES